MAKPAPENTPTTFQVIGQGLFQDTLGTANVVNSAVVGVAYSATDDGRETGNTAAPMDRGLAVLRRAHGDLDGGEAVATAEPAGVASVSFECAGVAGPFEITARVGTVVSNTIVGNCVGDGRHR